MVLILQHTARVVLSKVRFVPIAVMEMAIFIFLTVGHYVSIENKIRFKRGSQCLACI